MKNILKLLSATMVMAILISICGVSNIHAAQNEEIMEENNSIIINDLLIETKSVDMPSSVVTLIV